MSFGMIFSIILIVIFIASAFYGMNKIIDLQKKVQISSFLNDFQNDVERMQNTFDGEKPVSYVLPEKIEEICFVDRNENLRINGNKYSDAKNIEGINIEKTLDNKEELCIPNEDGRVNFNLEIVYGETTVTVRE